MSPGYRLRGVDRSQDFQYNFVENQFFLATLYSLKSNRRLLAFSRILCCNIANPVKVSASLLSCWTQWLVQPTSPTVILPRIPLALTGMQCSTSYRLSVSHTCVCTTGETLLKLCSTPSHA